MLWFGYAGYYLYRVNFSVAQPEILKEFPQWTAAKIGLIPSTFALCYAAGQLINGVLWQKLGARRMMTWAVVNVCEPPAGGDWTLVFQALAGLALLSSLFMATLWNPRPAVSSR